MNPVDELYTVPPAAFIAARNALVKELRRDGRREEADEVTRLRRPTATAWALNRVAREDPAAVQAVLDAAASLRAAMNEAVAGAGDALRRTQAADRVALRSAVDGALGRLRDAGQPAGDLARQRLTGTLRAAMVDDEIATRLAAGTLEADYEAPGLGITPAVVGPARPAVPPPDADARARKRQFEGELRRLEAEADRLARRAERLDETARDAEAAARSATAAAEEARTEARRAEAQVAAAREAAARQRTVD